jgi:signal peptidase II
MSKSKLAIAVILTVLFLDQFTKILVKTTMFPGQEFLVFGDWFRIHFLENNGMAFGFSFGGELGKLALSTFRIIAVGFIGYYIYRISQKLVKTSLVVSLAMIFAGAMGNILDSAFYGLIFSEYEQYGQVSTMFPSGGGYESFLHGRVVDMLYFPVIDVWIPQDFPIWPGDHFVFFRPVFNLADTSITLGVASILLFHRDFLSNDLSAKQEEGVDNSADSVKEA